MKVFWFIDILILIIFENVVNIYLVILGKGFFKIFIRFVFIWG